MHADGSDCPKVNAGCQQPHTVPVTLPTESTPQVRGRSQLDGKPDTQNGASPHW